MLLYNRLCPNGTLALMLRLARTELIVISKITALQVPSTVWRQSTLSIRCLSSVSKGEGVDQASPAQAVNSKHSSRNNDKTREQFIKHRAVMREKFPEGWNPPRKLSREAMDGLRALHTHDPNTFSTPFLADKFKISPEAVRRILRSKWTPSREKMTKLLERDRRRKEAYIAERREKERQERDEKMNSAMTGKRDGEEKDGLTFQ